MRCGSGFAGWLCLGCEGNEEEDDKKCVLSKKEKVKSKKEKVKNKKKKK